MMALKRGAFLAAAGLVLTACATVPTGPSVMVLPGSGKSFEQFQADDTVCRQWAHQQTGTTPGESSSGSGIASAAVGTALGAAAGAAIGAAAGNPAVGAAAGAGGGLLLGSAAGVGAAGYAGTETQRRYDMAYQQCMYAGESDPQRRAVVVSAELLGGASATSFAAAPTTGERAAAAPSPRAQVGSREGKDPPREPDPQKLDHFVVEEPTPSAVLYSEEDRQEEAPPEKAPLSSIPHRAERQVGERATRLAV
jgi:hypothetical protein